MANELISLSQLFQNRIFRIPDYQRGYAWLEPQLVDFWDDLINLQSGRYHYTGLLSLKNLKEKETENWGEDRWIFKKGFKPCHIVDGQQRLTTFVILLYEIIKFVRQLPENAGKADSDIILSFDSLQGIYNKYICQTNPQQGFIRTYLFGYESDNPSAEYLRYKVFEEKNPPTVIETYYTKNLKYAKEFFAENIKALYAEEGLEGINLIFEKLTLSLMFNIHEIDDDYDVFVAFETMNNRGKKLTNLELLKNRLIYLTTLFDDKVCDDINKTALRKSINDAWREVYYQLGRNSRRPLNDDEFLRAHWIIYYKYTRNTGDDYIKFLLNKFSAKNIFKKKSVKQDQEYIPEQDESLSEEELPTDEVENNASLAPNEIYEYVNSLKNTAKYWYSIHFPKEDHNLSRDEAIWLEKLNHIGIGYFKPAVTAALMAESDPEERVDLFKAIERFIFIHFRMGTFMATYRNSDYSRAARKIYKGDIDESGTSVKLSLQDFANQINERTDRNLAEAVSGFMIRTEKLFKEEKGYYSWNPGLKYFMYEYEYSLYEKTGVEKVPWELFSKSEKDKVTIEHILPQSPSKYYWRNQFRAYSADEISKLSGALGNLLPLSQSVNSALQNDSFTDKKEKGKTGRRGYSDGSHSEIEVSKETDWDAQKIYSRSKKLLQFMSKRWNCPLSEKNIEDLTYIASFVNDGREIPPELEKPAQITKPEQETDVVPPKIPEGLYAKYWAYTIPIIRKKVGWNGPFSRVSAQNNDIIDGSIGMGEMHLYCQIRTKMRIASSCVWINANNKNENQDLFELLYSNKDEIENNIGQEIEWTNKKDNLSCSIQIKKTECDFEDESRWPEYAEFQAEMIKRVMDHIIVRYKPQIKEITDHYDAKTKAKLTVYADIFKRWCLEKRNEGELIFNPENSTLNYTRYMTPRMSELIPDADLPESGWKTKNHYFYEIRVLGDKCFTQLALSGENIPMSIKTKAERVITGFGKKLKNNWQWALVLKTKPFKISEDMPEETIKNQLDKALAQIKREETVLENRIKEK